MEKISPPVRILAIVLVLVGVAGMLALRTMGPSAEPEAIPVPVQKPAKAAPAKQASEPAKAAAAKPAATAKAATPKRTPAAAKPRTVNPVVPKSGFPSAVDAELRRNEIVVVALVVPGARVDEIAAAEAEAGAKLGGAGFVALNVLNEGVARSLLAKVTDVQDPSVIVVTRAGKVAVELDGFVDRETVAQAAASAAP